MRRDAEAMKQKAIESVIGAVEFCNRPHDEGRVVAVLFFLQHAFEMLLKAAILVDRGTIRKPTDDQSYGFEKCCNIARSELKILTQDQHRTLSTINGLRDAATHYVVDMPESALYVHAQAGMTIFDDLLDTVCGETLADHLPERVLPLSTTPPRDIELIMDEEFSELQALVAPGRRQGHLAKPRMRHLLIMESSVRGQPRQPTDAEVDKTLGKLRSAKDWRLLFPGVAALRVVTDGNGPTITLRMEKRGDVPMRPLREGEDPDKALVYREVNMLDRYSMGLRDLATKLPITEPKTLALIRHLKLQENPECFTIVRVGNSEHKRYSENALQLLRAALREVDIDEVWNEHRPRRTGPTESGTGP